MDIAQARTEYAELEPSLEQLRSEFLRQIAVVLEDAKIPLGVPIESRVKAIASIEEKLVRKALDPKSLLELPDLVGIRLIALYSRDAQRAVGCLCAKLSVLKTDDAADKLGELQFGYQSVHLLAVVPDSWGATPTLSKLVGLRVEIQVRTLAQHIWAATSHQLQYKREEEVPKAVRRSINRVAALLETVDLEYERLLEQRENYVESIVQRDAQHGELNVDMLSTVLAATWPERNRSQREPLADLLSELRYLGFNSGEGLRNLLSAERARVLSLEADEAAARIDGGRRPSERSSAGVYYSHVGLTRAALRSHFGEREFDSKMDKYRASRK